MEPDNSPVTNPQPEQPNVNPVPATVPAAEKAPLAIPAAWPGAFGAYKFSKQAVKVNLEGIIIFGLISIVLGGALQIGLKQPGQFLAYILGSLFTGMLTILYISGVRQHKIKLGESFSKGLKVWLNIFLLNILVTLTIILSVLLLVIPFFFVWPRFVLANYFLIDKNMGIMEAYKASWHATKGYAMNIYGIAGANIAMGLLVITIIGIPFAIYFLIMYSAATAVLYELILNQPTAEPVTVAPAAEPVS